MFGLLPCSAWRIGSGRSVPGLLAIGFTNNCSVLGILALVLQILCCSVCQAANLLALPEYEQLFALAPAAAPGWLAAQQPEHFWPASSVQRQQIFLYHLILFLLTA